VVDEYGGTAGIVTLQDIIAEIIGDGKDESGDEEVLFKKIDDTHFWCDAKINLDDLSEVLAHSFKKEDDFDTLGGLIMNITGQIPDEKEKIKFENLEFEIEKLDGNRIVSVLVHRLSPPVQAAQP
jgi:magnesium and cobalt transporter